MFEAFNRRSFIKGAAASTLLTAAAASHSLPAGTHHGRKRKPKLSLNAYSFNQQLRDGVMSLEELLHFCSRLDVNAIDITAYYLPPYPQVPEDAFLCHVKQKAFLLGLEISGTGVRNDFTLADEQARCTEKNLVKNWIVAAAKLGAPVLRIFTGKGTPQNQNRAEVFKQVAQEVIECAEFASTYGVMLAIQNHADLLQTAADVHEIMRLIQHPWVGMMIDIGSFRGPDPYQEIRETMQYAITWQIKEKMHINGKEQSTDLEKLFSIIHAGDYCGYLPIETLGPGDPHEKVTRFVQAVRKQL
jgi:sugar phosphate isomerase/epimerase